MIDVKPIDIIAEKYWHICRMTFEVLMWTHVIFMVCFTYFMIPTNDFMFERFYSNGTNLTNGDIRVYGTSYFFKGLFLIWPILLLIHQLTVFVTFSVRVKKDVSIMKKLRTANSDKLKDMASGFLLLPVGLLMFTINNLSHISSLAFSASYIAWYIMYVYASDAHSYLESLAMAYIFGWLHTINFVKGFKEWNSFANILKIIIKHDVTRFIYIYIFMLISFGFAVHVLMISDYWVKPGEEQQSSTSTIYFMFYRMLSPDKDIDLTGDDLYKESGGNVAMLRAVWAAYNCITTVVMMNLLIAMINKTYSDVQDLQPAAWKVDSLRLALWVERLCQQCLPLITTRMLIKLKIEYNTKMHRWYMPYTPVDIAKMIEDDDDGIMPHQSVEVGDSLNGTQDIDAAILKSIVALRSEVGQLRKEFATERKGSKRRNY